MFMSFCISGLALDVDRPLTNTNSSRNGSMLGEPESPPFQVFTENPGSPVLTLPPSSSQQGLSAVIPRIPHISEFVFHATIGGLAGQAGGCVLPDQTFRLRAFVSASTLVQTRLFSD